MFILDETTSLDSMLPLRRELPFRSVGKELMVRDPENGQVHFLNPTAAVIWNCCDGANSLAQCQAQLLNAFAIPEGVDLEADIRETIADLNRRKLIVWAE